VEPVAEMRDRLATITPPVDARDGTAESLPLDDASVDAVTVAQAFHWFDPPKALAEIRRVLRPGGHLFLLWNMRDRRHGWVSEFGDLLVDGDGERPYDSYHEVDYAQVVASAAPAAFGPVEWWEHAWEQPCDEDLLVARAASVSVVGLLAEPARTVVLDRVRNLARTHPELAGKAWFGFPYVTRVWRCRTT
jgi:SAM-dependent methyltransferase